MPHIWGGFIHTTLLEMAESMTFRLIALSDFLLLVGLLCYFHEFIVITTITTLLNFPVAYFIEKGCIPWCDSIFYTLSSFQSNFLTPVLATMLNLKRFPLVKFWTQHLPILPTTFDLHTSKLRLLIFIFLLTVIYKSKSIFFYFSI